MTADTPEPAPPPSPPAAAPAAALPAKRPLLIRLFAISIWGGFKLLLLCVLVGLIIMAINFDPRSPDVDMGETVVRLARQAWSAAGWAVANFWKPALAGASVVLPIWVLWRLVSLPFRK